MKDKAISEHIRVERKLLTVTLIMATPMDELEKGVKELKGFSNP